MTRGRSALGLINGILSLLLLGSVASAQPHNGAKAEEKSSPWRATEGVHGSLATPEPAPNLSTPQATVEYFLDRAREGDFEDAAYALNFELLDDVDAERGAELARELHYVLNQKLWIDWEDLPDRRDGMGTGSAFGSSPMASEPRQNISLGTIDLSQRVLTVRVQRVKVGSAEPVWLFSAQTVENIAPLYEAYGPGWFAEQMPAWAKERGLWRIPVWQWIGVVVAVVLALASGVLLWWLLSRAIGKQGQRENSSWRGLARKLRLTAPIALSLVVLYVCKTLFLRMTGPVSTIVDPLLLLAVVAALTALVSSSVSFVLERFARGAVERHASDGSDEQRRLLTQISIAKRVFLALMALVAIGIVLLELQLFETVGIALLASAGAGGVILGLAGQTVLGNLLAGIQIAITQPFRIGDSVYIEDNWGRIEEITYTYVVVRTWDHRRLIFPVRYFLENYIENWSKTHRFLIKPIYLHVDYRTPVGVLRDKYFEFLRAEDDWEETEDSYVAVLETNDETMVVRLTAGAATPSAAWFLSLRLRERLVAWLQEFEGGRYLPRQRVAVVEAPGGGRDERSNGAREREDDRPTAQHAGADAGGGRGAE